MALVLVATLVLNCRSNSAPEDQGTFLTSIKLATERAAAEGQHVFIHVGADWCKPCRALHKEIYPQPAVEQALSGFIKLELDMDELSEEHVTLIRAMNVQSIPMVAVFGSDMETLVREPVVAKADAKWVLNYLKKESLGK